MIVGKGFWAFLKKKRVMESGDGDDEVFEAGVEMVE